MIVTSCTDSATWMLHIVHLRSYGYWYVDASGTRVLTLGILMLSSQLNCQHVVRIPGMYIDFIISLGHRLEDNLEDHLAVLRTT